MGYRKITDKRRYNRLWMAAKRLREKMGAIGKTNMIGLVKTR